MLNQDYNLGAANIPCRWDDEEFGEWTEVTAKSSQFTARDFMVEYGTLIATVLSCIAFVAIFTKQTRNRMHMVATKGSNRYPRDFRIRNGAEVGEKSNALVMPSKATSA